MRPIILASAVALAVLFGDPTASRSQELGIGLGSITTGALSGTVQGVQSQVGAGSLTALAGIGVAGATAGQTATGAGAATGLAACNGNNCASAAGNIQQNTTQGAAAGGSFALGGALSGATGIGAGQSLGESIGQGGTTYNYGSIFAQP
jgi:hypothetical protein